MTQTLIRLTRRSLYLHVFLHNLLLFYICAAFILYLLLLSDTSLHYSRHRKTPLASKAIIMASNVVPWYLRPEYLAATNRRPAPGDPMRYGIQPSHQGCYYHKLTSLIDVPRPFPAADPTDRTSYHAGQRTWSINNLPDILYQIYPDQEWDRFSRSKLPEPKVDQYGRVMLESWPVDPMKPRKLLNFTVLVGAESRSEREIC